jgi:hypothetical protein
MIKVENIETWGFKHAIRGMRNPMNSWDKSDTIYGEYYGVDNNGKEIITPYNPPQIGQNDLALMRRLCKAGEPHRKFLRQVFVSMDITAPLYWWKEFDTYKVGTVANSCSTMHKIHAKKFELDDFSHEHLNDDVIEKPFKDIIDCLNFFRVLYIQHKNKDDWWQMIQLLPSSYNQKRTISMNYENVVNMIEYRTGHKLDEWNEFIDILWGLPYLKEIAGEDE